MCWKKPHQTSFRWKNFLFLSIIHEISVVIHFNVSQPTNKQHRTDLLQIKGPFESPATCSYTQQDTSWVEHASGLSFIPLWLLAGHIFLWTSYFLLSSSSPYPQQQITAPQTSQPGVIKSESSRTTGASSNVALATTQWPRRHQSVHCEAAIAATKNMTKDTHMKKVLKTGRSNDSKQHSIVWEQLHIDVEGGQLTL